MSGFINQEYELQQINKQKVLKALFTIDMRRYSLEINTTKNDISHFNRFLRMFGL